MIRRRIARLGAALASTFLMTASGHAEVLDWRRIAVPVGMGACRSQLQSPPSPDASLVDELRAERGGARLWKRRWANADFRIEVVRSEGRQLLYFAEFFGGPGKTLPLFRVVLGAACDIRGGELIEYREPGTPHRMIRFGPDLRPRPDPLPFNPPVPPGVTSAAPCTPVALLDTGINYLLPAFEGRLAKAEDGGLQGHDLWEGDDRPFDFGLPPETGDPWLSPFAPPQHGTSLASIFLADAPPEVCIAPYRYFPADRRDNIGETIDRIVADGVGIVVVATGRDRAWPEFQSAMRRHPGVLFVAAAGNQGFDLSRRQVYPQVYDEPNLLVVAATEAGGALWPQTNRGEGVVDLAVPATDLAGFDFTGRPTSLTGTSFASPRVAAWAAMLARGSDLGGAALHDAILEAVQANGERREGIWALSAAAFDAAKAGAR